MPRQETKAGRDSLSLVIPAFNEERRLSTTGHSYATYLNTEFRGPWELIIVDDGSTDETTRVSKELRCVAPDLRLIRLPTNQGKGAAVRAGVLAARYDLVLFADADGATPARELSKLLDALDTKTDIVNGSRIASSLNNVSRSWYRRSLASAFRWLQRVLVKTEVRDTQCGFKLFRRDVARYLFRTSRENRYLFDLEVLAIAYHHGLKVLEVPIEWHEIPGSKDRIVRDSLRMLVGLVRLHIRLRSVSSRSTDGGEQVSD